MIIITPRGFKDKKCDYTLLYLCGMAETVDKYLTYYLEKSNAKQEYPWKPKYSMGPIFEHLPGNYRLIFFHGPKRQITRLNDFVTTAWFNVKALPCNDPDRYTMEHVYESTKEISDFIEQDPINCDWFLAGFSMGSCMSLALIVWN